MPVVLGFNYKANMLPQGHATTSQKQRHFTVHCQDVSFMDTSPESTSGKTKEEVDRQHQGLQPTGVDAHWSRQSCTGSTSMAEHRKQLGLPARKDFIFIAKALSQVSQVKSNISRGSETKQYLQIL